MIAAIIYRHSATSIRTVTSRSVQPAAPYFKSVPSKSLIVLSVAIASDHRGFKIKARLIQSLTSAGYDLIDAGTDSDSAVDYPDFASEVAKRVSNGEADRGILICGTGIGMSIAANKFSGVRAASCYDEVMVEISRRHNDVNVLCLPGDMIGERPVDDLVLMWLNTEFDGGRHEVRIKKIGQLESVQDGDAAASLEKQ